jgi:hypothetical protein
MKACVIPALVLLAALAGTANANDGYSSSLSIGSVSGSGGVIVNTPASGASFTSTNGTMVTLSDIINAGPFITPGTISANIGNLTVSTTSSLPDNFTVNYTDVINITNPSPGGLSSPFTITGTLTFSGVEFVGGATSGTVSNVYHAPFTSGPTSIGGSLFTVSFGDGSVDQFFGPPTINNQSAGGNLGAQITSVVPEPASLSLLALGGAGLLARRRRKA